MHLCRLPATPPLSPLLFSSQDPSHCWASAPPQPVCVCVRKAWGRVLAGLGVLRLQVLYERKALNVQCCISATGSCREATICAMWSYLRRLVVHESTSSFSLLNLHLNLVEMNSHGFLSFQNTIWVTSNKHVGQTDSIYGLRFNQSIPICIVLWGLIVQGSLHSPLANPALKL